VIPTHRLLSIVALLGATTLAFAEGAPPTLTDDTGTPGDRHWEFDLGFGYERRPGVRSMELPGAELRYGIGANGQVTVANSYLTSKEDGLPRASAIGDTVIGGKWRFYDAGEKGLSVSMHPQVSFNTPGSSADRKGLVDDGTTFVLPLQFQHDAGPVTLVAEVGREFNPGDDAWCYGAGMMYPFSDKVMLAVELNGGCSIRANRSALTANVSLAVDLDEHTSLLLGLGRELHNDDEPRASLIGFVGIQWRR
jgi:hypothetical protein